MAVPSKLDAPVIFSGNHLQDVIRWLKADTYVVLHGKTGNCCVRNTWTAWDPLVHLANSRFYHDCAGKKDLPPEQVAAFLATHRIVYLDVSVLNKVLEDGEWNMEIETAKFVECTCSLKDRISKPDDRMPHKQLYRLERAWPYYL
jgi:hypothetical protein